MLNPIHSAAMWRTSLFISIFLLISFSGMSQTTNPNFDAALVEKLGADDYGMKMYVFVILKSGENKTTDRNYIDSCFVGHLKNINRLAEQKQLVVAGPFGKNESDFRGLFILNVSSTDEAKKLLQTDPAINARLLSADLFPWYGSAALPEYLGVHDKIWKLNP